MSNASKKRLATAEKRLSEIEKILRGHNPKPQGHDYVSPGDWFPTNSGVVKELGNDFPHALQRHSK